MAQTFGEWLGESFGKGGWISDGISEAGAGAVGFFGGEAISSRDERIQMAQIEADKAKAQAAAELEKARLDALNNAYANANGGGGGSSAPRRGGNMGPAGVRQQPWKYIPTIAKAKQVHGPRSSGSSGGSSSSPGGFSSSSGTGLLVLLGTGAVLAFSRGGKKNA